MSNRRRRKGMILSLAGSAAGKLSLTVKLLVATLMAMSWNLSRFRTGSIHEIFY